jgi:hypothetical protein
LNFQQLNDFVRDYIIEYVRYLLPEVGENIKVASSNSVMDVVAFTNPAKICWSDSISHPNPYFITLY